MNVIKNGGCCYDNIKQQHADWTEPGQALRITCRTSILRQGEFYRGLQRLNKQTLVVFQFGGVRWRSMLGTLLRQNIPTLSESQKKIPGSQSPPSMPRKLHVTDCSSKPKCTFELQCGKLFSKSSKKSLNNGCSAWNQLISLNIASSDYPSARELVLPLYKGQSITCPVLKCLRPG